MSMNARGSEPRAVRSRIFLGKLAPRGKRLITIIALLCVSLGTAPVVLDQWIMPLPAELLHRPNAGFVYSREGKLLTAFTSSDQFWRLPVTLDEISPKAIASVITIEDRYFYQHPGVNPVSLVKSAIANYRAGRTVRGGSTVTMQIARMIEPKARTLRNKLFEIFRALQLEIRYSKAELLEMYFNLAPYGGNIEGIGAAAHFYFEKNPSELTWAEAAVLTAIPGSPETFRPDRCADCARERVEVILARLRGAGVITESEYQAALVEEIPVHKAALPRRALHLATRLWAAQPDSATLHTTVRYDVQVACEQLAAEYHRIHQARDIHNLAIVVIDNRSAEVIAQVGSPDFEDDKHSGQVDASMAPRSPGSALKPFVYGLAFDGGILSPEMVIPDLPVSYRGYRPVNYDETYRGVVSVRQALIHSLNIPAVNAASEVGLQGLYETLTRGGLSSLDRSYYEYGLPLILGACEVRLKELADLYAALARQGVYKPASTLLGVSSDRGVRLFSPEACYLISDILVDLRRPELPEVWRSTAGRFPVAWKTGTSYGRRDAWAIGYTPSYTVGVWAGNCTGEGSVDLVGASIAAPVMFDVFAKIVRDHDNSWFEPPAGIGQRQVCAVSGQPVGRFCEKTTTELFIIGRSPAAACSVHRPIFVDSATGLRLKADCLSSRPYEKRIIELWPPRIATWMVNNNLSKPLPPYDPNCRALAHGDGPCIVSPEDGSVFEFIEELPSEYQKIRLQASIPSGDGTVHWFLDGIHLAAVQAGEETFLAPTRGRHMLVCMDATGRSATASFDVN